MKKSLFIIVSICIIITFSGCKPYQGKRPFDYPPARWISETPNLWFDVESTYEDATKITEMYGQLISKDQAIDIIVTFGYTNEIIIRQKDDSTNNNLTGHCQFSPEKLIVIVETENDSLLDGQYDSIIFIRTSLPTIEKSKPSST